MKKNLRNSNHKKGKVKGFRYRNKTSDGKKIISRRRRIGSSI